MDKLLIELPDGIYNHIMGFLNINNDLMKEIKKLNINLKTTLNYFTILWILTLIIYWFK